MIGSKIYLLRRLEVRSLPPDRDRRDERLLLGTCVFLMPCKAVNPILVSSLPYDSSMVIMSEGSILMGLDDDDDEFEPVEDRIALELVDDLRRAFLDLPDGWVSLSVVLVRRIMFFKLKRARELVLLLMSCCMAEELFMAEESGMERDMVILIYFILFWWMCFYLSNRKIVCFREAP